jgi:hypothetical protein
MIDVRHAGLDAKAEVRVAASSWNRSSACSNAEKRVVCPDCKVGINIDAARLVRATKELRAAVPPGPNEITIKFFR